MKEREPTHSERLSASKKERSTNSPEIDPAESGEDRLDEEAMLVPAESGEGDIEDSLLVPPSSEEEEFESLSATRISNVPVGPESEDALIERDPTQPSPSKAGASSKRTTSILGDFQLVKKLGQGAMASVYKARQLGTDRRVALKLLHKHVADNPKLVERFYREARIMGQLDHPNIVQGYSVGEIDGFHYCAMEYISGANLQQWLNRLVRLSVPDSVHVAICCARALDYAHDHDLVHRDIKPDNVLITKHGQVKVADLGMVKALDEDMSLTQTGHAVGTPWYMPLEQAKNAKDVDGRSDIYALGCMIYCMLTGRPPFRGGEHCRGDSGQGNWHFSTSSSIQPGSSRPTGFDHCQNDGQAAQAPLPKLQGSD